MLKLRSLAPGPPLQGAVLDGLSQPPGWKLSVDALEASAPPAIAAFWWQLVLRLVGVKCVTFIVLFHLPTEAVWYVLLSISELRTVKFREGKPHSWGVEESGSAEVPACQAPKP